MVETLFYAKEEFNDDLLILYSDIMISKNIINILVESKQDISVCVDVDWKDLHKLRFADISEDLESCSINSEGFITDIGAANPIVDDVDGRYFGAIRLSPRGCDVFKAFYHEEINKGDMPRKWMRGRDFDSIFMTDFLQGLIENGYSVGAVKCNRGWLEFDSEDDLKCYKLLESSKRLHEFVATQ